MQNIIKKCMQPRFFSTTSKPKTGILLMNMGGPEKSENVYDFLFNLFSDREIIQLPFQQMLAKFIAKNRTPKIQAQYNKIGGGSPITKWTKMQGESMIQMLNQISPESGPHKYYIGFRYVPPFTSQAIDEMHKDGIQRAVAFSQYPQFSCSTTGSSINELTRLIVEKNSQMLWSLIDRWPTHAPLVQAFATHIRQEISRIPEEYQSQTVILFSAHSLPLSVVDRGDTYPQEVSATVQRVMEELDFKWSYRLVWQSKVGPKKWLGPHTDDAMKGLAKMGKKSLLLVPIAFTSDHIETLHEMDIEYCTELAAELKIPYVHRCASMNDNPVFIRGMAELVSNHLNSGVACSTQYRLRCPNCTNYNCGESRGYFRLMQNDISKWASNTFSEENKLREAVSF